MPLSTNADNALYEGVEPVLSGYSIDPECPICHEQYGVHTDGDEDTIVEALRTRLCGHIFCWFCLRSWFESGANTCPMCRRVLYELPIIPRFTIILLNPGQFTAINHGQFTAVNPGQSATANFGQITAIAPEVDHDNWESVGDRPPWNDPEALEASIAGWDAEFEPLPPPRVPIPTQRGLPGLWPLGESSLDVAAQTSSVVQGQEDPQDDDDRTSSSVESGEQHIDAAELPTNPVEPTSPNFTTN